MTEEITLPEAKIGTNSGDSVGRSFHNNDEIISSDSRASFTIIRDASSQPEWPTTLSSVSLDQDTLIRDHSEHANFPSAASSSDSRNYTSVRDKESDSSPSASKIQTHIREEVSQGTTLEERRFTTTRDFEVEIVPDDQDGTLSPAEADGLRLTYQFDNENYVPENLRNSSFEDWTNGEPDNWVLDNNIDSTEVSEETTNVHDGGSAIKVDFSGDEKEYDGVSQQPLSNTGDISGRRIYVDVWTRTGGGTATPRLWVGTRKSGSWTNQVDVTGTQGGTTYEKLSGWFTVPQGHSDILVELRNKGNRDSTEVLYWDDVSVVETFIDDSTTDNWAVPINDYTKTPNGKVGSTADNNQGYAAIHDFYEEPQSSLTVSAWVKGTDDNAFIASYDRSEYWRFSVGSGTTGGHFSFNYTVTSESGQTVHDRGSGVPINDDKWHHIAAVFDNGETKLYVDGNLEATFTDDYSQLGDAGSTRYGFLGDGSEASSFDGRRNDAGKNTYLVDDFRVYNRALSQEEIQNVLEHPYHRDRKLTPIRDGVLSFSPQAEAVEYANIRQRISATTSEDGEDRTNVRTQDSSLSPRQERDVTTVHDRSSDFNVTDERDYTTLRDKQTRLYTSATFIHTTIRDNSSSLFPLDERDLTEVRDQSSTLTQSNERNLSAIRDKNSTLAPIDGRDLTALRTKFSQVTQADSRTFATIHTEASDLTTGNSRDVVLISSEGTNLSPTDNQMKSILRPKGSHATTADSEDRSTIHRTTSSVASPNPNKDLSTIRSETSDLGFSDFHIFTTVRKLTSTAQPIEERDFSFIRDLVSSTGPVAEQDLATVREKLSEVVPTDERDFTTIREIISTLSTIDAVIHTLTHRKESHTTPVDDDDNVPIIRMETSKVSQADARDVTEVRRKPSELSPADLRDWTTLHISESLAQPADERELSALRPERSRSSTGENLFTTVLRDRASETSIETAFIKTLVRDRGTAFELKDDDGEDTLTRIVLSSLSPSESRDYTNTRNRTSTTDPGEDQLYTIMRALSSLSDPTDERGLTTIRDRGSQATGSDVRDLTTIRELESQTAPTNEQHFSVIRDHKSEFISSDKVDLSIIRARTSANVTADDDEEDTISRTTTSDVSPITDQEWAAVRDVASDLVADNSRIFTTLRTEISTLDPDDERALVLFKDLLSTFTQTDDMEKYTIMRDRLSQGDASVLRELNLIHEHSSELQPEFERLLDLIRSRTSASTTEDDEKIPTEIRTRESSVEPVERREFTALRDLESEAGLTDERAITIIQEFFSDFTGEGGGDITQRTLDQEQFQRHKEDLLHYFMMWASRKYGPHIQLIMDSAKRATRNLDDDDDVFEG